MSPLPPWLVAVVAAAALAVPGGMLVAAAIARHAPDARRPPRPVWVAITGVVFAAVAAWAWTVPMQTPLAARAVSTAGLLAFAALGVALCVIDVRTHRLPNVLVLPAVPVAVAVAALSCLAGAPWSVLIRGLIGGAALFTLYLAMRLAGGGVGGGDVKLAGLVGIVLGACGWPALVVGSIAAFVLGGSYGALLVVLRRAGRRTRVPFGPWMLLGAWVGILGAQPLAGWYLGGGGAA